MQLETAVQLTTAVANIAVVCTAWAAIWTIRRQRDQDRRDERRSEFERIARAVLSEKDEGRPPS